MPNSFTARIKARMRFEKPLDEVVSESLVAYRITED